MLVCSHLHINQARIFMHGLQKRLKFFELKKINTKNFIEKVLKTFSE